MPLPKDLRYSSDDEPGISRRQHGRGFAYYMPTGEHITNEKILSRIKTLGLPPAYEKVWICPDDFGHIQATGRDDMDRKQYRYHDLWQDYRNRVKYDRLAEFGEILPRLRRKVTRDLRRDKPDYRFACAALIRLIDRGALRIGNRGNAGKSFGASTLQTHHLEFTGTGFTLNYPAKGGKRVNKPINDTVLAHTLEEIDDLPGRNLFQYIGEDDDIHRLDSADVNAYIPEDFTAKTFRTWHGTVAAFKAAQGEAPTIKSLCEASSKRLHNTPAICRTSYIHPCVIELTKLSPEEQNKVFVQLKSPPKRGLRQAERACLKLISD